MAGKQASYRGCLLGLAVGDAMGYTVDRKSWQEIREDYGPYGLRGYDLANGYADVTSYTQIAAYTCNGLLLGLTRGQVLGKRAPYLKYIELSAREWAVAQRPWGRPARSHCWLSRRPDMTRRHCMDTRMLDTLSREKSGALGVPVNSSSDPGSLTAAIGVGLFFRREKSKQMQVNKLGADAVSLTCGNAAAGLSGAALTHIVSNLIRTPAMDLEGLFLETAQMVKDQYGHQFSQAYEVTGAMELALSLAGTPGLTSVEAMERLRCGNAPEVLAGAVYACLVSGGDFDSGIIAAVNHSGRSAAVGAITGAILGLRAGEEALPEFYMDGLEPVETLRELADDLTSGCPMDAGSKIFDLDWDYKYLHGGT